MTDPRRSGYRSASAHLPACGAVGRVFCPVPAMAEPSAGRRGVSPPWQGTDGYYQNWYPIGFARVQWDTWSPPGWFDDEEFDATARSFENPDWLPITLHAYRSRFH